MYRILSVLLAMTFWCAGLTVLAQPSPPEKNQYVATWAAEALESLQKAGIWLTPPGNPSDGRRLRRDTAAIWFQRFLYHFPPQATPTIEMEKQMATGRFAAYAPDSNFDVYHYFLDGHWEHWADGTVILAIQRGLLRGYPDHRFQAGRDLTRGELATMVCRLLLYSNASISFQPDDVRYSDVSGKAWWSAAAQIVSRCQVMQGYPDHTFRGSQPVTTDEVIVTLARVLDREK